MAARRIQEQRVTPVGIELTPDAVIDRLPVGFGVSPGLSHDWTPRGEPLQGTPRMAIAVVKVVHVDAFDDEQLSGVLSKLIHRAPFEVREVQPTHAARPEALGLRAHLCGGLLGGYAAGLTKKNGIRWLSRHAVRARQPDTLEQRQRQEGTSPA
jgi:hypothetical protein